ncbi:SRPBCC family protein [Actinomycetospora sp. CA-084318]|uniref:SRPBCC family protein n=1 Tax=Actinomycetospora sp. CA-084318 TaxID=3239892 RepID=UPI003D95FC64
MAGPVKESISIAAPVSTVVDIVADLENTDRWANEAKGAEVQARGDDGRPTRIKVTLGAIGFTTAAEYEVAYTDSSVTLTCTGDGGRLIRESVISYEAAESGDGTELTMTSTMEVTVPVPEWGLERAMGRSARKNLASVKEDAERR